MREISITNKAEAFGGEFLLFLRTESTSNRLNEYSSLQDIPATSLLCACKVEFRSEGTHNSLKL